MNSSRRCIAPDCGRPAREFSNYCVLHRDYSGSPKSKKKASKKKGSKKKSVINKTAKFKMVKKKTAKKARRRPSRKSGRLSRAGR
jgi:hypothetical protein